MSAQPPTDPGRIILWLLAVILLIVVVALILSLFDVHT
jgi:cytochrome c-type biogenesis protein CcmH/NrfF